MSNKARKEGESIKQWRDRLREKNRNAGVIDGGELNPIIVSDINPNNTIKIENRAVGATSNNHRIGQPSLFGEREYNPNPSLMSRLLTNVSDALKLTSPPTYKDGYGRTLNAEVPLSESAQGQELQRMGETAMNTAALASIPFGAKYLYLSPLATAAGAAAGYVASEGTGLALDAVDSALKKHTGLQLSNTQKAIPQFMAGLVAGGTGFNWGTNATKRAIETAMHTTSETNPIPRLLRNFKRSSFNGKLNVAKYVLTGKNNNGTSNTLGEYIDPRTGEIGPGYYTGLTGVSNRAAAIGSTSEDDMVQTYLYRRPLKNMTEITEPNSYGVHEKYISDTYPGKKIPVYEMEPPLRARTVSDDQVLSKSTHGSNDYIFGTGLDGKPIYYDAAGHMVETGKLATGKTVQRQQDIWKFNSEDYMKRWLVHDTNPFKRGIFKWGLDVVDHHGTPVVVRSPWIVQ